ncbi:hypothetical protein VTN31DRAFT_1674 [Thermomyces dupontii]|uniref:uncharacterized protein n=1 Tax=Talaromyces thermophilus TaxID=28565 RepID=UPI003742EA1B
MLLTTSLPPPGESINKMMHWTVRLVPFLTALTSGLPPPPARLQRDVSIPPIVKFNVNTFRGICGTADPSERLREELARLSSSTPSTIPGSAAAAAAARVGSTIGGDSSSSSSSSSNSNSSSSLQDAAPIEIETWFHVVSSNAQAGVVTDEMLAAQLAALSDAYANTTITYKLSGITRTINDTWARNDDEATMKRSLRRGSYRTLNIYFQTDLQMNPAAAAPAAAESNTQTFRITTTTNTEPSEVNVLGFCTLPDPAITTSSPIDAYILDGCNIHAATMPGGPIDGYSFGGTTIHEVGHWHGLLHTFQGESCAPDHPGDYIADTPAQGSATEGCPAQRDSCPDLPGLDPIHNFMDYSSDQCYRGFTVNQAERMREMWVTMREGK